MRQYFYLGTLFFILFAFLAAGIYLFGRAIYTVYADWRLGKELDELQAEMRHRRRQRAAAGEEETGELS
jgi:hypothetical protein